MPTYARNKKALFDYEVLEELEAGLVLAGHEVKSARSGNIDLKGAHVTFHKNEPMLTNAHIGAYKFAGNVENHDPTHSRKLLLTKKEIDRLRGKIQEKGLTIVPLSVYTSGRRIKVKIAIVRGKKKYDKRQSLKEKDQRRDMERSLKEH